MKVYDYNESNKVISEAWKLAIRYLEKTLGSQYKYNVTENTVGKFLDYVQQDIEFMKLCPKCSEADSEGNFMTHSLYKGGNAEVCYSCYEELGEE